jgi:hypothetical protein
MNSREMLLLWKRKERDSREGEREGGSKTKKKYVYRERKGVRRNENV